MYRIEATVTTATPRELKITANCPLAWLQALGSTYALGSTEIERKLSPGETLEPLTEPVQEKELPFNPSFHPDLKVGDRVIVRCYFGGESR
jgi:hypothetical protein